jgi:hypothetical protein
VPDEDVIVEDVPDLPVRVVAAAAGESGHAPIITPGGLRRKPQGVVMFDDGVTIEAAHGGGLLPEGSG